MHGNEIDDLEKEETPIQKFYNGSTVFITGGTGFIGKLIIEKLLRCTKVAMIYICIRQKKGRDDQTRFDELFEDVIFQKMKTECLDYKHRVTGIGGDCSMPDLGLSVADRQTLTSKVDIIFHAAATVKFDEKLKLAFNINVNGIRAVLDLARQTKNLKSIVHVSTAYANCHVSKIEERFYDVPVNFSDLESMLESLDDRSVEKITLEILGNRRNTYFFTKAMAEDYIRRHSYGLPISIYRPGAIVSTYFEPISGWIDNLYGPTGFAAGIVSGLLRTFYCKENLLVNAVPADFCASAIVAAAWNNGETKFDRTQDNVPIYNHVSSSDNPIFWSEFIKLSCMNAMQYPLSKPVWKICFENTHNKTIYIIKKVFYHYVPAVIVDLFSVVSWQKPRLIKMYRKLDKFYDTIEYFALRDWEFSTGNVNALWKKMDSRDKKLFLYDVRTVSWLKYVKCYTIGLREYVFKDPLKTLDSAKRKQFMYDLLHIIFKTSMRFFVFIIAWKMVAVAVISENK